MARVILRNVSKVYDGDVVAVRSVSLEVGDREFVVLVGPSGCGKSTTLRMIAGLEEITEGEIYIGDTLVNDVAAKNRDIAMVFQNYALYPHMTVFENMAFGLKLRRVARKEIEQRVHEVADTLDIRPLLARKPKALSGGQRQRVAVGRAIVRKPKVFLFDEPLSNLDAKLRVQMRTELAKLHHRLQTTMIYVTHDQVEALTLGDRIVVMKDGWIQQIADPMGLYDKPANRFVAGFIGSPPMNFLAGTMTSQGSTLYFKEGDFRLLIPQPMQERLRPYVNAPVVLGMRPEDIHDRLFAQAPHPEYIARATVDVVEPMGSEIYLHLLSGKFLFVARVSAKDRARVSQAIDVVFDMNKAHFFDPKTERSILIPPPS